MAFDGGLLQYGLPGLALGLMGGIVTGIIGKNISPQQHATLKTCFKYATIFLIVCSVSSGVSSLFDYMKSGRNPRVTIAVEVKPSLEGLVPDSAPLITTTLTPTPSEKLVDVSSEGPNSLVQVNVEKLANHYKQLKIDNVQLHAQVINNAAASADRAQVFAAVIPTPPAMKSRIDKVLASAQPSVVAEAVCKESNSAQCGWAQLAGGNVDAASKSFAVATTDTSLPRDQVASATNGLGYTKLTQGKTEEAVVLIKKAAADGDKGATRQLQAVQAAVAQKSAASH